MVCWYESNIGLKSMLIWSRNCVKSMLIWEQNWIQVYVDIIVKLR
jgi:hypothetical protein